VYKPIDQAIVPVIKVPTGVAIEIPPGYVGLIRDRSSVSLTGLKVTAGVIDAGYTGEVNVCLLNVAAEHGCIVKGQKIAQILIVPVATPPVEVVKEFTTKSGRKEKGFGSTGSGIVPIFNE
jgi:dUTP pyrophosphatase